MTFQQYIRGLPHGGMKKIADDSGITYQSVKNLAYGKIKNFARWEVAYAIWKACHGEVEMRHLWRYWEDAKRAAASEQKARSR